MSTITARCLLLSSCLSMLLSSSLAAEFGPDCAEREEEIIDELGENVLRPGPAVIHEPDSEDEPQPNQPNQALDVQELFDRIAL